MRKRIVYIALFLIFILVITSYFVAKHVLPYAIIQPPRVSENISSSDLNIKSSSISIITNDSIQLKGYWIKNDAIPPKSIIIFAHGIGGCKEHFLNLSKHLLNMGIESVLIDSRAHGKSSGQYTTYGFKEKKDIAQVVDFIKKENNTTPIGIWGNSMGGAIAIQSLAYDPRIQFGIIESTFTDLRTILYDYQKAVTLGILFKPLCNIALNEAGKIADFDPHLVSPITDVQQITQPILMAHGKKDKKIKFSYGKALFKKLQTTDKQFITVENGGHFDLAEKGGETYQKAIRDFLIRHSK